MMHLFRADRVSLRKKNQREQYAVSHEPRDVVGDVKFVHIIRIKQCAALDDQQGQNNKKYIFW
jgi:hypothetical protein